MSKPYIRIVSSLILLVFLFTISGCLATTPIKAMNEKEKLIYDALIIGVKDFYNQQDAKVLDCGAIITNIYEDKTVLIEVQGTNKLGGTLTHVYELNLDGEFKGRMLSLSSLGIDGELEIKERDESISIGNINRALDYHWKEMGLK